MPLTPPLPVIAPGPLPLLPCPASILATLAPPTSISLPLPPSPAQHHNPFNFRHVTHIHSTDKFDDVGACVLMATPSGLQSGVSRDYFEAWCDDARNTVIIVDFAVQVGRREGGCGGW